MKFNKKCALIEEPVKSIPSNLITDRFLIPPFSILDTKMGYWQTRKRQWISIGIQSELGRGDNLLYGLGCFNYDDEKQRQEALKEQHNATLDAYEEKNKFAKCLPDSIGEAYGRKVQATSIFDPVLTEIAYRWFSRSGDKILDPFAGGSVRGIVAACLGRHYTGIDLSENQIKANKEQYNTLLKTRTGIAGTANWINDDSTNCINCAKDNYNMIMTCPPYYDLEVYSDKPNDISNADTYEEFLTMYSTILKNACSMVIEDSFAVCVVGDMRDKNGFYHDFCGDTIRIFEEQGFKYYNHCILVNVTGTLPVRITKQFNSGRKIGKQHQNVLIFYKGDTKNIKTKFGDVVIDD